jgi:hypothetical protein
VGQCTKVGSTINFNFPIAIVPIEEERVKKRKLNIYIKSEFQSLIESRATSNWISMQYQTFNLD